MSVIHTKTLMSLSHHPLRNCAASIDGVAKSLATVLRAVKRACACVYVTRLKMNMRHPTGTVIPITTAATPPRGDATGYQWVTSPFIGVKDPAVKTLQGILT